MKPEDMPENVWEWIRKQESPFLIIVTPFPPLGDRFYFDGDPEAVEAVEKTYRKIMSKRAKESLEKEK